MKEIKLTQGKVALVDDEDYEYLNQWKWHYEYRKGRNPESGYAVRNMFVSKGKFVKVRMHRVIMNAPTGVQVDHINHNGLDNRRSNLRLCSSAENQYGKRAIPHSSRFKGVTWNKRDKKWQALIMKNGKTTSLGYFTSEYEAAKAYDKAAALIFGEFAKLNFETEKVI